MHEEFARHLAALVHAEAVRTGSKLRNVVTPLKPDEAPLQDYYAGDWIDSLDATMADPKEMQVVARAGAYALGRKADEKIIDALDECAAVDLNERKGLTKAKVDDARESLDIGDSEGFIALVGWRQWSDLLAIEGFANADYVGDDQLPWKGTQAKHWLNTLWMPHSGLTKSDGIRQCHWLHRSAVGHAFGNEVKTAISWHGDRGAHFVNHMMAQGARMLDPARAVVMACWEG